MHCVIHHLWQFLTIQCRIEASIKSTHIILTIATILHLLRYITHMLLILIKVRHITLRIVILLVTMHLIRVHGEMLLWLRWIATKVPSVLVHVGTHSTFS